MSAENFLRRLPDDGLYLPVIKPHSFEKIRHHNYLARLFSTGMKKTWPQRAYIGLYSGAGRARVERTGEIIETTAMSVFRLPDLFTKYVFVDNNEQCTEALDARIRALPSQHDVTIIREDANEAAANVRDALPSFSRTKGLLSFCFVDPFAADMRFDTFRTLGELRMDFLILLMVGRDLRVNFERYFNDLTNTRVADLIDCPGWRDDYRRAKDKDVVRFLSGKFDDAMQRLGYLPANRADYHSVTIPGKRVLQYYLVLYSKNKLGQRFWQEALKGSTSQLGFGFQE